MWSPGLQLKYGVYGTEVLDFTSAPLVAVASGGSIVAAVTGKIIRVLALYGNLTATSTIIFVSTGNITGTLNSGVGVPIFMGFNPAGWFESVSGVAITCTIGSGTFGGVICYVTR